MVARPPDPDGGVAERGLLTMWTGCLLLLLQRPVLVFHPQVQPGPLDREVVVAIFLGKRHTWPDGTLIRPFELDSRFPEKRWFLQQVLGWSPKQYRHYWLQELMKGESRPTVVSSRSLLLELVRRTPGSIAIVEEREIPDTLRQQILRLPFP